MTLIEEAHRAARLLLDHAYVRIVARPEADSMCAAALLAHALRRENVDFHLSTVPTWTVDAARAIAEEAPDALVVVGLSADAEAPLPNGRTLAIDRHVLPVGAETALGPGLAGDAEPTVSTLAYYVALSISKRNRDLAVLALAGAHAESRHVGGLAGLERDILTQAVEAGVVVQAPALALHGSNLGLALAQMDLPFLSGLTGRARQVQRLLSELRLAADASPAALAPPELERLGSALALRLLAQEAPDAALGFLFEAAHRGLAGPLAGASASELARQVEAACGAGRPALAFSLAWADGAAAVELHESAAPFREQIVAALLRAERDRAQATGAYALVDASSAPMVAPLARRLAGSFVREGRVALARYEAGGRVLFAFRAHGAPAPGPAVRQAAEACGGRSAAGRSEGRAWVPVGEEGRFLKALAEGIP